MNFETLMKALADLGLTLKIRDDKVVICGDRAELTEAVVGAVRRHKAEILARYSPSEALRYDGTVHEVLPGGEWPWGCHYYRRKGELQWTLIAPKGEEASSGSG